jgi:hypothetical protein
MKNTGLFLLLGAAAALLAACETGTPDDKPAAATSSAASRKPEAAPGAAPAQPKPAEAVGGEVTLATPKVGLLECDQIADQVKACLQTKVQGVPRRTLTHSLDATLKHWHDLQDQGADAATLLAECQKARDAMLKIVTPYGCKL